MKIDFVLQKISLLLVFLILGSIAPWWIFTLVVIIGIFWEAAGVEILIVTVLLDVTMGGGTFALPYSYIALGVYIFYQLLQRILFK